MTNFETTVRRLAAQYEMSERDLSDSASAYIEGEHPELRGAIDELPTHPIGDRVDGLLGLIEQAGASSGFLTMLDVGFNPEHH